MEQVQVHPLERQHTLLLKSNVLDELDKERDDEGLFLFDKQTKHLTDENKPLENNNADHTKDNYGGTQQSDDYSAISLAASKALKIIYLKLLCISLVLFSLCSLALISAIIDNFYTWRGIVFNSICIFASLIGICCGIYYDNKLSSTKTKICKLKLLLCYFLISFTLCAIVFVVHLVYLILIPIRYKYHQYDQHIATTQQFILVYVAYFVSIIFWLILILFYIDIIARAVLKRGRIEWIIMLSTHQYDDDHEKYVIKSSFWWIVYTLIIAFRLKFRNIRHLLRMITGISCFYRYKTQHKDRYRDPDDIESSSHEEDRVIVELQMNATDKEDPDAYFEIDGMGHACIQLLCFPVRCVGNLMYYILMGFLGLICCPCIVAFNILSKHCRMFGVDSVVQFIALLTLGLALAYLFMPFFIYAIIQVIVVYIILGIKSGTDDFNKDGPFSLVLIGAIIISVPIILTMEYLIWSYFVCADFSDGSTAWDKQCTVWYWTSIGLFYLFALI